mgnify:CR=1 FL=1|tara:strand:- start:295 stop:510 length:216 start_codon:yes stop_codon:yes gene_type:complete
MLNEIEPKFTPIEDVNEMVMAKLQVTNRTRHHLIMREDKMLDAFGMDYLHEMSHRFSMRDYKKDPLFKLEQ